MDVIGPALALLRRGFSALKLVLGLGMTVLLLVVLWFLVFLVYPGGLDQYALLLPTGITGLLGAVITFKQLQRYTQSQRWAVVTRTALVCVFVIG